MAHDGQEAIEQARLRVQGISMSGFGLMDQCSQERANRFGHISLLPVVPEGLVALTYLEVVAELVSAAPLARVGCWGACGQKRRDQPLLVRGQVGRVEACDHVEPREATTADECEVHDSNVTSAAADAHSSSSSFNGPGPVRPPIRRERPRPPSSWIRSATRRGAR